MIKIIYTILISFVFIGCSFNEVKKTSSATILIKTPNMKFYDKGFINEFDNYVQVQIYSAGNTVLDLKIYENRICKSTFKCISSKSFNKDNLHFSYKEDFLYKLFITNQKDVVFRDNLNSVLIKIKRD